MRELHLDLGLADTTKFVLAYLAGVISLSAAHREPVDGHWFCLVVVWHVMLHCAPTAKWQLGVAL